MLILSKFVANGCEFPVEKVILRAATWLSMGMTDEAIIILREESFKIAGTQAMLEYQSAHNKTDTGMEQHVYGRKWRLAYLCG
jgi:hypothetical protein